MTDGLRWEALCPGGLRFVYGQGQFPPGLDSFVLASLPRLKPGLKVCDLGCGTGFLVQAMTDYSFYNYRVMFLFWAYLALGGLAAAENGLTDRLAFRLEDLRETALPAGSFDLAVCNPPYFPPGSGPLPREEARRTARTETSCTLEEVCRAAAWSTSRSG